MVWNVMYVRTGLSRGPEMPSRDLSALAVPGGRWSGGFPFEACQTKPVVRPEKAHSMQRGWV